MRGTQKIRTGVSFNRGRGRADQPAATRVPPRGGEAGALVRGMPSMDFFRTRVVTCIISCYPCTSIESSRGPSVRTRVSTFLTAICMLQVQLPAAAESEAALLLARVLALGPSGPHLAPTSPENKADKEKPVPAPRPH